MYVIAFTSGRAGAETLSRHSIQLQYGGSNAKTLTLYDRPGVDFELNKGDLWTFSLSIYGCITLSSIQQVSVVENGIDGWNIESIVTLVSESTTEFKCLHKILVCSVGLTVMVASSSDRRFDLMLSATDINPGIIIYRCTIVGILSIQLY